MRLVWAWPVNRSLDQSLVAVCVCGWPDVIVLCWIFCLTLQQLLFSEVFWCCLIAQRVLFDDVLAQTEPVYVFCSPCRDLIIQTSTPAVDLPVAEEKSLFARLLRYTRLDSSIIYVYCWSILNTIVNGNRLNSLVVFLCRSTGVEQSTILLMTGYQLPDSLDGNSQKKKFSIWELTICIFPP